MAGSHLCMLVSLKTTLLTSSQLESLNFTGLARLR